MEPNDNTQNHDLIPITRMEIAGQKTQTVNLRHLHARLGSKQEFVHWIKHRIEVYGFLENQDFVSFVQTVKRETEVFDDSIKNLVERETEVFHNSMKNLSGGRPRNEFYGTLGMAKELAMVERTEMGRKVRKYFIACERRLLRMQKIKAIEDRRTAAIGAFHLSRDLHNYGLDIYDVARLCMFRQAGLTQKESASALGVSREKVQKIERQFKDFGIKFAYIPGNKRSKMAFDSFNSLFFNMEDA